MACRQFGAKVIPEPMLGYYSLDTKEHALVKFSFKKMYLKMSAKLSLLCHGSNMCKVIYTFPSRRLGRLGPYNPKSTTWSKDDKTSRRHMVTLSDIGHRRPYPYHTWYTA